MFSLSHPHFLWLLAVVPLYWAYELLVMTKHRVCLSHPDTAIIRQAAGGDTLLRYLPIAVRSLVLILLIAALAGPRFGHKETEITGNGIDIVLALDISKSMEANDFLPNRLEAARRVAKEFIGRRKQDRLGLVTFSGTAFTQCPLTTDNTMLLKVLDRVQLTTAMDGTAIGMGLGMAVSRLNQSKAKSKVIILITDGNNNTGEIDPFTAAGLASSLGIKVYPIGVGSSVPRIFGNFIMEPLDMDTLNRIAASTGTGEAHLATNADELESIMSNIDRMEKSTYEIKHHTEYREMFPWLLMAALLLLILETLARLVRWRTLP
jgi:Ca-activated chloride channel family protein